nr:porin PorA family protein [Candidatus Solincola tengchongensis]
MVLGLLLVLLAILWWAFAPGLLVKIPKGVNTTIYNEGKYTWYVNPLTYELLPEGQALVLPAKIKVNLHSEDEEYDADTAVISGSVESSIGDIALPEITFTIVLDRSTAVNQSDSRAYIIREGFLVDRSGYLSYVFPFGTKKTSYDVWKEEIGAPMSMNFVGEDKRDGLTVFNFAGGFEEREVLKEYIEFLGLPASISGQQLEGILTAMGIDARELLALAQQRMSPEDKQALDQALAKGVPIKYYWSCDVSYSVEPTTGLIVDCDRDWESTTVKVDQDALTGIFAIFAKYLQDPVLGPVLQRLASAGLSPEKMSGVRVMEYEFSQTEESVKSSVADAIKGKKAITFVKLWIPLIILIVGLIVMLVGLFVARRKGKSETKASSSGSKL